MAQDNGLLKKLAAAGIKVIAVDFRENPIKNTVRSVESVAKAVGREAQGQAFAHYYLDHVAELQKKLAQYPNLKPKKVFIERAAGYSDSCCRTFANGNMGAYIPF